MAKAKKLPSGNWRVQLYVGMDDNGKRIYKSFTAETKKKAEFLAAEYSLKRKEKPKGITVGDAINNYIRSKENILSPTTIDGYRKIRRTALQGIMDLQISEINNLIVQSEINREATRLSPKSIRNAHGLLSAALAIYLPEFTLRTTLPAKEHKIKRLPRPAEVLRAVQETEVKLPVTMAIWLGMRLSEIQGLRFSDISGDIIKISHVRVVVKGKYVEKDSTKTYGSTRLIHAPPEIMNEILSMPRVNDNEYIFEFAPGGIYKRFQAALKSHNVPHMSFHDLRHMNASVMVALGIPDKYAMERGGWSSNSTLQNVYQHTFSEERLQIDKKIDDYFRGISKEMQHEMQHDKINIT